MEAWSSLRAATPRPIYTKAAIQAGLRTPAGASVVWIDKQEENSSKRYKMFLVERETI